MAGSICIIGDSITAGVVMTEDTGRYYHCPESFVNLLSGALELEVRNRSRFGCRVTNALARPERWERDAAECEHTVVMLGGNDSDFDWAAVAAAPEEFHDCYTPYEEFIESYGALLDRIIALGGSPVVTSLMPVDGRKYYSWLATKNDGAALMRFLGGTESIEHWNELYSVTVMKLAMERRLPVIDLRSALLKKRRLEDYTSPDGIHPSVLGHRAIFEGIVEETREILK